MVRRSGFSFVVAIPALLLVLLGSCSVQQTINIEENLSGRWIAEGEAQGFAADTLDDLALLGGYNDAAELYSSAVIDAQTSLLSRSSVQSALVVLTEAHSWKSDIRFTNLEDLLGGAGGNGIAEIMQDESTTTLRFRFDRNRSKNIEVLIPLLNNPALSIFNPASTGNLSEENYITDILGFTFGTENLPAIRASKLIIDLSLPGNVEEIRGGVKTGSRSVRFEAALTRILVPENNINWTVSWSSNG